MIESPSDDEYLQQVNNVVQPFGCVATDLGPDAVAVKGDGREVGPSVLVTFPSEMSMKEIGKISTKITNEVPHICRVLMNLASL